MGVYESIYQNTKWLENDYNILKPMAFVNFPAPFVIRLLEHIKKIKEYLPQASKRRFEIDYFNHITLFYDYNFTVLPVELEELVRANNIRLVKFSLNNLDSMSIFLKHEQIFINNIYLYKSLLKHDFQSVFEEVNSMIMGFIKHFKNHSNQLYFILPDYIFKPDNSTIYRNDSKANNDFNINTSLYCMISDTISFYQKFFDRKMYRMILPIITEIDKQFLKQFPSKSSPHSLININRDFIPLEYFTLWFLEKYVNNSFNNQDYLLTSNYRINENMLFKNYYSKVIYATPEVKYLNTSSSDCDNIIQYLPTPLKLKSFYDINVYLK